MNHDHIQFPFIRKLMAGKSEEEIEAAEDRFVRVLLIIKGIADREFDSKPGPIEKEKASICEQGRLFS